MQEMAEKPYSFRWPETEDMGSHDALDRDHFEYKKGVLSFLGYHVGRKGLPSDKRRSILDYAYNGRLPRVNSEEYMEEWDAPRTGPRLHKTANCLAALTRNAKKKTGRDMSQAIEEWEEDLAYLKVTYYDGRYDGEYDWPGTGEDDGHSGGGGSIRTAAIRYSMGGHACYKGDNVGRT